MCRALEQLGLTSLEGVSRKDLKKAFRKRSLALLPEKHPSLVNAHSRFEDLNSAFVEVGCGGQGGMGKMVGTAVREPGAKMAMTGLLV